MRIDKDISTANDEIDDDIKNDIDDGLGADSPTDMYGDYSYGFDGMTPTPMEKHADLLKQLTNFEPYIRQKVHGWLGLRWDTKKEIWIPDPYMTPIMNKRCASWCIDYLRTYTRNNNIITNIREQEYKWMVCDIVEVLWIDIGTRMEEFGIRSIADLHRICVELQHAAELILMGAGDGKYNKLLSETTSRHENMSSNPAQYNQYGQPMIGMGMQQPKKKGFMSRIKNFVTGGT